MMTETVEDTMTDLGEELRAAAEEAYAVVVTACLRAPVLAQVREHALRAKTMIDEVSGGRRSRDDLVTVRFNDAASVNGQSNWASHIAMGTDGEPRHPQVRAIAMQAASGLTALDMFLYALFDLTGATPDDLHEVRTTIARGRTIYLSGIAA